MTTNFYFNSQIEYVVGWDSAVGIASRYELDGSGIEFRVRVSVSFHRYKAAERFALITHPHLLPMLK